MSRELQKQNLGGKRILIPCDLDSAREGCLAVKQYLQDCGLNENELMEWELILAEGINNAVSYVPESKEKIPVEVDVIVAEKEVTVRIHDCTEGIQWPEDAQLPSEDSEGGRGIYLIQTLTEYSDYRKGRHGNSLTMRRSAQSLEMPLGGGSPSEEDSEIGHLKSSVESLESTLDAMTEELSSCYESLSAIFHFSSELGQTQKTKDFAKRLLDHVLTIAEAEWFVFRKYYPEKGCLSLLSASDDALQFRDLEIAVETGKEGIELTAVRSRQDEWLSAEEDLSSLEPLHAVAKDCHVIVHPIYLNEELLGVLSVGRPGAIGAFKAAQISFINTFAEFLGIQIVNVGYEHERISKGIITRELEIAQNIQRSLLPNELPNLGGFELAASCESAREVGGDFYDVISLDEGCFVLVIADVMGKGIPAALFAAILRSLIRALPERAREPAGLMTSVNRILHDDLSGVDMFITAQIVYVDPGNRLAKVSNAGHCPALFASSDRDQVEAVFPEGMPIGVLEDTTYQEGSVALGPSSKILIYTDGITEAANESNEQFGDERLQDWLASKGGSQLGAESLKSDMLDEVQRFMGDAAPRDDMTFIVAAQKDA